MKMKAANTKFFDGSHVSHVNKKFHLLYDFGKINAAALKYLATFNVKDFKGVGLANENKFIPISIEMIKTCSKNGKVAATTISNKSKKNSRFLDFITVLHQKFHLKNLSK